MFSRCNRRKREELSSLPCDSLDGLAVVVKQDIVYIDLRNLLHIYARKGSCRGVNKPCRSSQALQYQFYTTETGRWGKRLNRRSIAVRYHFSFIHEPHRLSDGMHPKGLVGVVADVAYSYMHRASTGTFPGAPQQAGACAASTRSDLQGSRVRVSR